MKRTATEFMLIAEMYVNIFVIYFKNYYLGY